MTMVTDLINLAIYIFSPQKNILSWREDIHARGPVLFLTLVLAETEL